MTKKITQMLLAFAVAGVVLYAVAAARPAEKTVQITAKRFEFTPGEITLKKGEPVVIEITSEDVKHGFSLPDFGVKTEVKPGQKAVVRFTPDKTGRFTFTCNVFCGDGHEDMSGTLTVTE